MTETVSHTQSNSEPLTYEQEVHSILWAASAITEDLLLCFKAQAERETGEAKKLTLKCISWREDDLRRIKALIPQALERRDENPDSLRQAWEAGRDAALQYAQEEFDVPRSEGNNVARQDACDNVMRAIRALAYPGSPAPASKKVNND